MPSICMFVFRFIFHTSLWDVFPWSLTSGVLQAVSGSFYFYVVNTTLPFVLPASRRINSILMQLVSRMLYCFPFGFSALLSPCVEGLIFFYWTTIMGCFIDWVLTDTLTFQLTNQLDIFLKNFFESSNWKLIGKYMLCNNSLFQFL